MGRRRWKHALSLARGVRAGNWSLRKREKIINEQESSGVGGWADVRACVAPGAANRVWFVLVLMPRRGEKMGGRQIIGRDSSGPTRGGRNENERRMDSEGGRTQRPAEGAGEERDGRGRIERETDRGLASWSTAPSVSLPWLAVD